MMRQPSIAMDQPCALTTKSFFVTLAKAAIILKEQRIEEKMNRREELESIASVSAPGTVTARAEETPAYPEPDLPDLEPIERIEAEKIKEPQMPSSYSDEELSEIERDIKHALDEEGKMVLSGMGTSEDAGQAGREMKYIKKEKTEKKKEKKKELSHHRRTVDDISFDTPTISDASPAPAKDLAGINMRHIHTPAETHERLEGMISEVDYLKHQLRDVETLLRSYRESGKYPLKTIKRLEGKLRVMRMRLGAKVKRMKSTAAV